MKTLSIDIETYSSVDLAKCGVYKYTEATDFDILLFGYSTDGGPVQVVDLACGETIPQEVIAALTRWICKAEVKLLQLAVFNESGRSKCVAVDDAKVLNTMQEQVHLADS